MEPNVSVSDEAIFSKVQEMLNHLDQSNKLQQLAIDNGLDVKNSIDFSGDNRDRYAIATTALMLAKRSGDPKYEMLVRTGLQKRELKAEIINTYKDEAKQLITRCENRMTE